MPGIRVRVVGIERTMRKLHEISTGVPEELRRAIALSAKQVEGQAIRNISRGTRSGRVYPPVKGRRGAPHRASAPGEFPKRDTGILTDTITHRIDEDGLGASVGTNTMYGLYLEFGTKRMGARPWLLPTFRAALPKIRERMAKAMLAAMRRTVGA